MSKKIETEALLDLRAFVVAQAAQMSAPGLMSKARHAKDWDTLFGILRKLDIPQSDIFYSVEDIEPSSARYILREYNNYADRNGRIGELGFTGSSQRIANKLGVEMSEEVLPPGI